MKDFEINIEYEDGNLYISNENGSGCNYDCNNYEDISKAIAEFIDIYIREE